MSRVHYQFNVRVLAALGIWILLSYKTSATSDFDESPTNCVRRKIQLGEARPADTARPIIRITADDFDPFNQPDLVSDPGSIALSTKTFAFINLIIGKDQNKIISNARIIVSISDGSPELYDTRVTAETLAYRYPEKRVFKTDIHFNDQGLRSSDGSGRYFNIPRGPRHTLIKNLYHVQANNNDPHLPFKDKSADIVILQNGLCFCKPHTGNFCNGVPKDKKSARTFLDKTLKTLNTDNINSGLFLGANTVDNPPDAAELWILAARDLAADHPELQVVVFYNQKQPPQFEGIRVTPRGK